ncbi:class I SAM-dependent methyltransferase [Paracoccus sp. p4-l81]|uniref:class I SAM-dependent methyltransferase n=1 Tax=Paracoccus sp. p4-l81 TaxID=3342806 RepID=UPI0035B9D59E
MTPLARLLADRIRAEGPLSLADYMADCLLHPKHGYYATRDPFGRAGDFITAPEISQMFGELVGLALAQAWLDAGSPHPFLLVEIGPGRGTLMADAWRATRAVPGFHAAARLWLIEASPHLRGVQARALSGVAVDWAEALDELPEAGPLFLIGNEFLDALPIRQFTRQGAGWAETRVGLTADGTALTLGRAAPQPVAALDHRLDDTRPGQIVEICPAAEAAAATIAARIAAQGGLALLIDYGDAQSLGDTFQALRGHQSVDPLAEPGLADLTAHVAFEPLARAARAAGADATGPVPQGLWLERLGVTARAQALATRLTGTARDSHIAAHRRLTHPGEMGQLFKVLAIHRPGIIPPGLAGDIR